MNAIHSQLQRSVGTTWRRLLLQQEQRQLPIRM